MKTLAAYIEDLLRFLRERDMNPPSFTEVMVIDSMKGSSVSESYFAELLSRGYRWVNVSYRGIYEGKLIVGIEYPEKTYPGGITTSVNLSGPSNLVVNKGWKLNSHSIRMDL
jgi:hypothetical protein